MSVSGKNILITGGAGFIGSHLAERLVDGNQVIAYDNLHHNALKSTKLIRHKNFTLVKGDILDTDKLRKAIDSCHIVIHAAAIAGVENVINSPYKTLEVNLQGTHNLLEAINGKSKNLKRFVFLSTSEVYGPFVYHAEESGMTTQGQVGQQRWSYAVSKTAGEHWTYAYFKRFGLPVVIIRPFNIYGPRQVGESAISKFSVASVEGKPLTIFGNGHQIRSWCYIDDFIDGVIASIDKKSAIGEIYNIGNPDATVTVSELAKMIKTISRSNSQIISIKRNYPDVELRIPSIEKAQKELHYSPRVDLAQGLKKTIAWYKK